MSDKQKRIAEIEAMMSDAAFWNDKERAQAALRELNDIKTAIAEEGRYERGNAIITIFSGAGGDDAEDFSHMLLEVMGLLGDKLWLITIVMYTSKQWK